MAATATFSAHSLPSNPPTTTAMSVSAYDPSNTLPPRTRALLVRQAHKLQRLLGETPHVELAIDLSSARSSPAVDVGASPGMGIRRRNTLTTFAFPLPSPPPAPLDQKPTLPKLTLTHIPRLPSPPLSPSFSPVLPAPVDSDTDTDSEEEVLETERRKTRARLAKLARWTGETVPPELVLSKVVCLSALAGRGRHSHSGADERTTEREREREREKLHARSRSAFGHVPPTPVSPPVCPLHGPFLPPLPSPRQTQKRTAKLSRFFGVPEGSLPPPPPPTEGLEAVGKFASEGEGSEDGSEGGWRKSMSSSSLSEEEEDEREAAGADEDEDEPVELRLPYRVRSIPSQPPSPTSPAHKHSQSLATTTTATRSTHTYTTSLSHPDPDAPSRALSPFLVYSSHPSHFPAFSDGSHSHAPAQLPPQEEVVQVHIRPRGAKRGEGVREVRGRMTELERGEVEEVMRRLRMLR